MERCIEHYRIKHNRLRYSRKVDRSASGSIFESDSITQSAFRFELERHNNSTGTTFKLDKYEKTNHVGNNLELIKES